MKDYYVYVAMPSLRRLDLGGNRLGYGVVPIPNDLAKLQGLEYLCAVPCSLWCPFKFAMIPSLPGCRAVVLRSLWRTNTPSPAWRCLPSVACGLFAHESGGHAPNAHAETSPTTPLWESCPPSALAARACQASSTCAPLQLPCAFSI